MCHCEYLGLSESKLQQELIMPYACRPKHWHTALLVVVTVAVLDLRALEQICHKQLAAAHNTGTM